MIQVPDLAAEDWPEQMVTWIFTCWMTLPKEGLE